MSKKKDKQSAEVEPQVAEDPCANAREEQSEESQSCECADAAQECCAEQEEGESKEDNEAITALQTELETLKLELEECRKKNHYQRAEFDNYMRRTAREKQELVLTASKDTLADLLPVIDNFERALESLNQSKDLDSVREGVKLIHKSFVDFLHRHGVEEIPALGEELDTDKHAALSKIAVEDPKLKGKIAIVNRKGYTLKGQVLRHAEVLIGE